MLNIDDIYNDLSKRIMAGEFLSPEKDSKELASRPAGADDDLFSSCKEQAKRKNATERKTGNAKRKTATAQMKEVENAIHKAQEEIAKKMISCGADYASDLEMVKDETQKSMCENVLKYIVNNCFNSNDAISVELRDMIWGISSRREKALKEQDGDKERKTVIVNSGASYNENVAEQNIHPLENERKLLPGSERSIKTQRR